MSEAAIATPVLAPPAPAAALRVVPEAPQPPPLATAVPRLEIPRYQLEQALALASELGVSHALAQVLVRRGLTDSEAARAFLDPRERHPPSAFQGIERAVQAIEHHLQAGSRITVHGDYDVDGVCATAVLVRALRILGADVDWFLPGRMDDGYGLSLETVRRLAQRGTRLLVTVDCAITAVDEVATARDAGIDVVVTDHHAPRPDGMLPECPVVHPRVCEYPCPELCATTVAYKLAQAIGAETADRDLDLVALATVADLMPLRGENRTLVREGLRALANTGKPGLRALMAVTRSDPSGLDTGVLGFRLAPRINAAGRLGRADAALELLMTADPERAEEIAAELDAVNAERRAVEQRIEWEAQSQVEQLGERFTLLLAGEDWHPGVIGIVASRIAERYHRPAILIALCGGDLCQGSARSIPGFDLLAALDAAAAHLERYGGHRAAAGMTVRRGSLEAVRAAVERHAGDVLAPELLEPVERIDAIVSGPALGLTLADELESLEPCGIGNPRPRLFVPGARFEDLRAMGDGRHLRFSVTSGGTRARAVAFGCDGRLGTAHGEPVDATFRLERNCWNGAVEPRLVLRHARCCDPAPIQVLGEPDDYLRAVLEELERPLEDRLDASSERRGVASRTVLERPDESPLAVLADAIATGGSVLAVCADVHRRLSGLGERIGGFSLISYHSLTREPATAARFGQLVVLDPPASPYAADLVRHGTGFTHLAWGPAELRFAQQMHELEYGLRASLVALYRSLRLRERAAGEELEHLLRGDGPHGRPPRLAARLIRVLAELELVSLDRDLVALAIAGTAPTALEHSPSYRVYAQRYEDGRRYLNSVNPRPSD